MANGPRRDSGADEPGYDWLYGTRRKGVGGSGAPAGANDATQVQRQQPRSGPSDPEPTRMLPTVDRPSGRRSPSGGPFETPPPPARSRGGGSGGSGGGDRARRPAAPPPSGPSRSRRRPRLRWLKVVLALWLVFLIAVPL